MLSLPIAFHTTQTTQRFHDISNEVGAYDLNATKDKWENSSPQIRGRSLGSIIAAAAATFVITTNGHVAIRQVSNNCGPSK
jgi:hypothetical protein